MNHDEVLANPLSTRAQIEGTSHRLYQVYRRMHYLEKLHIVIEPPQVYPSIGSI